MKGLILSVVLVVLATLAAAYAFWSNDQEKPGEPPPHAIDQSQ
jgi:hypothetical protein